MALSCGKSNLQGGSGSGKFGSISGLDATNVAARDKSPILTLSVDNFAEEERKFTSNPVFNLFSKLNVTGLSKETFKKERTRVKNTISIEGPEKGLFKESKMGVDLNWEAKLSKEGLHKIQLSAEHSESTMFDFTPSKGRFVVYDKTSPVVSLEHAVVTNTVSGTVDSSLNITVSDLSAVTCDNINIIDLSNAEVLWKHKSIVADSAKLVTYLNVVSQPFASILASGIPVAKAATMALQLECVDEAKNNFKASFSLLNDKYSVQFGAVPDAKIAPLVNNPNKSVFYTKSGDVRIKLKLKDPTSVESFSEDLVERDRNLWKVYVSDTPYTNADTFVNHRNTLLYPLSDEISYPAPAGWVGEKSLFVTLMRQDGDGVFYFVQSNEISFFFDNTPLTPSVITADSFFKPKAGLKIPFAMKVSPQGAPVDPSTLRVTSSIDGVQWSVAASEEVVFQNDELKFVVTSDYDTEVPLRFKFSLEDFAGNASSSISRNVLGSSSLVTEISQAQRDTCRSGDTLQSKLVAQVGSKYFCETKESSNIVRIAVVLSNHGLADVKLKNINASSVRLSNNVDFSLGWYNLPEAVFAPSMLITPVNFVLQMQKSQLLSASSLQFDISDEIGFPLASENNNACYAKETRSTLMLMENNSSRFIKSPFPCED